MPEGGGRGRARWIAGLAVAALIAGLVAAWWLARPVATPEVAGVPEAGLTPPDDEIHRGLRAAAEDSAAIKMRWVEEIPALDLSDLSAARREVFVRFANARRCTCGCGYTLAACQVYDTSCEISGPLVATLLDSVRAGSLTSVAGIRERPH